MRARGELDPHVDTCFLSFLPLTWYTNLLFSSYKEYLGSLPWPPSATFIVFEIFCLRLFLVYRMNRRKADFRFNYRFLEDEL